MSSSQPSGLTYPQLLEYQARVRPDSLAVATPHQRATWRALAGDVTRHGAALQTLGVGKGAKVGILMPNCYEWVVWAYAAASIGAVVVPANTRFREAELAYQLTASDTEVLVLAPEINGVDFMGMLQSLAPELAGAAPGGWRSASLPRLRHVVAVGAATAPMGAWRGDRIAPVPDGAAQERVRAAMAQVAPDDPAIIQYTSGSTAFPKGVLLSHRSTVLNAFHVNQRLGIEASDRIFVPGPFFHVGGSTLGMLLGLLAGAPIYTLPRFDPAQVLDVVQRERITAYSGVDSLFLSLYKHADFHRDRFASVCKGWIASSPEVVRMVQRDMGFAGVANCYGISEASPNITVGALDEPPELRAATCGLPHAGCEVKVVDPDTGREQPRGDAGEILFRGYSLMLGYYKNPEETAKAIDGDGWLHTGDKGVVRPSGHLEYHGRIKDMLRVGGENLAPAQVEEVLLQHPKVRQAVVVGLPDERLVEVPAAVVELKDGERCTVEEINAWCQERLAPFKVPRIVAFVDQMPMTGSGKIQKFRIRQEVFGISPEART